MLARHAVRLTCRVEDGDGVEGLLVAGASAGAYVAGTCNSKLIFVGTSHHSRHCMQVLIALTCRKDLFGIMSCNTALSLGMDFEAKRFLAGAPSDCSQPRSEDDQHMTQNGRHRLTAAMSAQVADVFSIVHQRLACDSAGCADCT